MNDQMSMQVVCRRSDAPSFEKLGFRFETGLVVTNNKLRFDLSDEAKSSSVLVGEASVDAATVGRRGGVGQLPRGVPFFGCHGPAYDPGVFATGGKKFQYATAPSDSPHPSVAPDAPGGELDPKRRREVQRYQATLLLVKARFMAHLQQHSPDLCRSEPAASPQWRTQHE